MGRELQTKFKEFFDNLLKEGVCAALLTLEGNVIKFNISSGLKFEEAYQSTQRILSAEQEAWESAMKINAVNSYRKYLKSFPDGLHKEEAESAIQYIKKEETPGAIRSFSKIDVKKGSFVKGFFAAFLSLIIIGVIGYFIINGDKKVDPMSTNTRQNLAQGNEEGEATITEDKIADDPIDPLDDKESNKPALTESMKDPVREINNDKKIPEPLKDSANNQTLSNQKIEKQNLLKEKDLKEPKSKKKPPLIKEIVFISVHRNNITSYRNRMRRIIISGLKGNTKPRGEIRIKLNINEQGQLSIKSFMDSKLEVTPVSKRIRVIEMVKNKIRSTRVEPPIDKSGNKVRVKNWILNYKVGFMQKRLILNLIN